MARQAHRNKFKNIDNTGFGTNSNVEGGRLTNKDGTTNLFKTGMPFYERISIYHTLLRMPRSKFLGMVFLLYTSVNVLFAFVYVAIGVNKLQGTENAHSFFEKYVNAFFFSSQTLTTVGYGHISPSGFWANAVASLESLLGILVFALVTGIFYARFSRPRAYILFSDNLLVAPYKGGRALMFRLATFKNNHLTDVDVQLTVAMHVQENGQGVTRFYQLPVEISRINSLAISWTIVHPLNENSPMYQFTETDFSDSKIELIVAIRAFDDHFSNTVQQRTSYTHEDLVYGARFLSMIQRSVHGSTTVLELDKINAFEHVALPEAELRPADAETLAANS